VTWDAAYDFVVDKLNRSGRKPFGDKVALV